MTREQQDAVLEALTIAVVTDFNVEADEAAQYEAEASEVLGSASRAELEQRINAARARVAGLRSDADRQAFLAGLAGRIGDEEARRDTLRRMINIMGKDGALNEREKKTVDVFSKALGVPAP